MLIPSPVDNVFPSGFIVILPNLFSIISWPPKYPPVANNTASAFIVTFVPSAFVALIPTAFPSLSKITSSPVVSNIIVPPLAVILSAKKPILSRPFSFIPCLALNPTP